MAMMRPFLFLLIAVLVAGVAWDQMRRGDDLGKWHALPKGGEIRVAAVTFGTKHEFDAEDRTLLQRFKDSFRAPNLAAARSAFARKTGTMKGERSLCVWFEMRGRTRGDLSFDGVKLRTPEGDVIKDIPYEDITPANAQSRRYDVGFHILPYRAANLRVSAVLDGAEMNFKLANPLTRVAVPNWISEPLPQTHQQGDVALTLLNIEIGEDPDFERDPHCTLRWVAEPSFSITRKGQKADDWYFLSANFHTPGGNISGACGLFSEPVWRVRAFVGRRENYPCEASDIHWIGLIAPEKRDARNLLEVEPGETIAGVQFAGVLDPGSYEFDKKGACQRSSGQMDGEGKRVNAPSDRTWSLTLTDPACVLLADETNEVSPQLFWRPADGSVRRVEMDENPRFPGFVLLPLPSQPAHLGILKEMELEFDFYIPAPKKPDTRVR